MVTLVLKIITVLLFYVMPFFQKSVRAVFRSSNTNQTEEKRFDFRDVVKDNSMYSPFSDKCSLRIYGGKSVDISEVPYQVVIRRGVKKGDRWYLHCGGSIITRSHVLSAAHCFGKSVLRMLRAYRVIAGTSISNAIISQPDRNKLELEQQLENYEIWRRIKHCFKHAYYNARHINHDMAVLVLQYPLTFAQTVQPIPMLRPSHGVVLEEHGMCLVSGFGLMELRNPSPTVRMVCVPLVASSKCKRYYGRNSVTNYQFCAGEMGMDSCQGDSGGPITYKGYLIGIVSYGGRCGEAPGVYTLVSAYTSGAKIPFKRGHSVTLRLNTLGIAFIVLLTFIFNFLFHCTFN